MKAHQTRWRTVGAFVTDLVVLAACSTTATSTESTTSSPTGTATTTALTFDTAGGLSAGPSPAPLTLAPASAAEKRDFLFQVDRCDTGNQGGQTLQVYPDERPGTPYEPGFHSSIDTMGDIESLAVVGPVGVG